MNEDSFPWVSEKLVFSHYHSIPWLSETKRNTIFVVLANFEFKESFKVVHDIED